MRVRRVEGALDAAILRLATELSLDKIRVDAMVPTWMWGPRVEGCIDWMESTPGIPPEDVVGRITESIQVDEVPSDGDVAGWSCRARRTGRGW